MNSWEIPQTGTAAVVLGFYFGSILSVAIRHTKGSFATGYYQHQISYLAPEMAYSTLGSVNQVQLKTRVAVCWKPKPCKRTQISQDCEEFLHPHPPHPHQPTPWVAVRATSIHVMTSRRQRTVWGKQGGGGEAGGDGQRGVSWTCTWGPWQK